MIGEELLLREKKFIICNCDIRTRSQSKVK